jgi:hypothetical protein
MTAHSNVSREHRAALGRLGGLIGGKARAAKYTHDQLRQFHTNQLRTRLARMTPEQAHEFQLKAARGRWHGLTADERSAINRKLIERRWAKVAYAKNQEKADRLYAFLQEYISAKHCAPTLAEITRGAHQVPKTVKRLLQILERMGRIHRHTWNRGSRGITLNQSSARSPAAKLNFEEEPAAPIPRAVTVTRPTKKCYDCDEPAIAGKTRCQRHLARYKGAYAQKKLDGICVNCDEPAVEGSVRCERHLRLSREASAKNHAKKARTEGSLQRAGK